MTQFDTSLESQSMHGGSDRQKAVNYSMVIPVYCNEETLRELFQEIWNRVIVPNQLLVGEVIFIDDGSSDRSLSVLQELREKYLSWVTVVKLTRNFGQVNAIRAGMLRARSECIVVLSADQQDPVDLVNEMLEAYFKEGFEIVIGERESREDGWTRAWLSGMAYRLIRFFGNASIPERGFDYVLLGSRVSRLILSRRESNFFLQGQIVDGGFRTKKLPYKRKARRVAGSGWSLSKRFTYFLDGVFHCGVLPVSLLWLVGGILGLSSIFVSVYISVVHGLEAMASVRGVLPVVLGLGAIQSFVLGLLLEYMSRTLQQVRGRPSYIVDQVWNPPNSDSE